MGGGGELVVVELAWKCSQSSLWLVLPNVFLQLPNVVVQFSKRVFPNLQMCLSKFLKLLVQTKWVFLQIAKCMFPNCPFNFSNLQNVFLKIAKYICLNYQIYLTKFQMCLSKLPIFFFKISKMYLSKLPNVFVQIEMCIFGGGCGVCVKVQPAAASHLSG